MFAFYIELRDKDRGGGFGYGRPETRDNRVILRALFLISKANVIFGDWGCPEQLHPTSRSDEELKFHCTGVMYCLSEYRLKLEE